MLLEEISDAILVKILSWLIEKIEYTINLKNWKLICYEWDKLKIK